MARKKLGEILLERGIIDQDQLNSALAYQRQWGHRLGVALVAKAIEGELDLTRNFKDHMYRCLACLACNDICPVGIKPADLCLEARYAIHQATPTPLLKPILFQGLFPRTGIAEVGVTALPAPTGFALVMTPNAGTLGNYDFSWASLDGKLYDLVSSTDLTTAVTTWPVWEGNADILLELSGGDLETVHLNTGGMFPRTELYNGYSITLDELKPHPVEGVSIEESDYTAVL